MYHLATTYYINILHAAVWSAKKREMRTKNVLHLSTWQTMSSQISTSSLHLCNQSYPT